MVSSRANVIGAGCCPGLWVPSGRLPCSISSQRRVPSGLVPRYEARVRATRLATAEFPVAGAGAALRGILGPARRRCCSRPRGCGPGPGAAPRSPAHRSHRPPSPPWKRSRPRECTKPCRSSLTEPGCWRDCVGAGPSGPSPSGQAASGPSCAGRRGCTGGLPQ